MIDDSTTILTACGRTVGPDEVRHAQHVVKLCSGLSRKELALTLCEHWGWIGAGGKAQERACSKLLERLERKGVLALPAKRGPGAQPLRPDGDELADTEMLPIRKVKCTLGAAQPVRLDSVDGREATSQFNGLVQRYHPLGYKRPFGRSLRYNIASAQGPLGCVLMAAGARALRSRDDWIGWSTQQRLANLPLVINNSRFLVFPWVHVPHLASHVLGQLARQVQQDWHGRWNYRPVLMETFVDPAQHRGVCYRAAGWQVVGETSGEGLRLRNHTYQTSRKLILVRPLVRNFRTDLLKDPHPV